MSENVEAVPSPPMVIRSFIASCGRPLQPAEIRAVTGFSSKIVSRALYDMRQAGHVVRAEINGRNAYEPGEPMKVPRYSSDTDRRRGLAEAQRRAWRKRDKKRSQKRAAARAERDAEQKRLQAVAQAKRDAKRLLREQRDAERAARSEGVRAIREQRKAVTNSPPAPKRVAIARHSRSKRRELEVLSKFAESRAKPVKPSHRHETVDEFLARGGVIQVL